MLCMLIVSVFFFQANEWIPLVLRASFSSLLMVLYVDRYPQQEQRLPETIHTLRDKHGEIEMKCVALKSSDIEAAAVEGNTGALPSFSIIGPELGTAELNGHANQDLIEDPREHMNHRDNMKFDLVQSFAEGWFKAMVGKQAAANKEENQMT